MESKFHLSFNSKNIHKIIIFLLYIGLIIACKKDKYQEQKTIKHVILFIGDGMNLSSEVAASRYLTGIDNGLIFHSFADEGGYDGFVTTWDVTTYNSYAVALGEALYDPDNINPIIGYDPIKGGPAPYPLIIVPDDSYFLTIPGYSPYINKYRATDSASAATAIATGIKTDNGNISWKSKDPIVGMIPTIAEQLRDRKKFKIGAVSTVQFTDATIATFVAHATNRYCLSQDYIARKGYRSICNGKPIDYNIIKGTKPDVVIGGGHPALLGYSYIGREMYITIKNSKEYTFVERRPGVNGSASLIAATNKAIKTGKKLFGLYGGIGGNYELPQPVNRAGKPAVSKKRSENPWLKDTVTAALKVLSADNDKGFFVMFEQGDIDRSNHNLDYASMIGAIYDLNEAIKTAIDYVDQPGDNINWDNTILLVTSDHSNSYMRLQSDLGQGLLPAQTTNAKGNFIYPNGEVTYQKGEHTNEPVMIYIKGKRAKEYADYEGLWYPGTTLTDNTHIYEFIKKVTGLK